MRQVACPILRKGISVLVFDHPLAGTQLVKGGMHRGETPTAAALRELWEEAGIVAMAARRVAVSAGVHPGERWHFVQISAPALPRQWVHDCSDDGGHLFRFRWHPLAHDLIHADPRFNRALRVIRGWSPRNTGPKRVS